eukprot:jgi/Mesen1/9748/ME000698S09231
MQSRPPRSKTSSILSRNRWWRGKDGPAKGDNGLAVDMVLYTAYEYSTLLHDPRWSQEETDHLFELCARFDLRFIVIADRFGVGGEWPERSVEDLKQRYYSGAPSPSPTPACLTKTALSGPGNMGNFPVTQLGARGAGGASEAERSAARAAAPGASFDPDHVPGKAPLPSSRNRSTTPWHPRVDRPAPLGSGSLSRADGGYAGARVQVRSVSQEAARGAGEANPDVSTSVLASSRFPKTDC